VLLRQALLQKKNISAFSVSDSGALLGIGTVEGRWSKLFYSFWHVSLKICTIGHKALEHEKLPSPFAEHD